MVDTAAGRLDLRAGHPSIDFVNTVAWRGDDTRRTDYLIDYSDLIAWSAHAAVLRRAEADDLAGLGAAQERQRVMASAKRLREALHDVWVQRSPQGATVVADAYRTALRHRRLQPRGDSVVWDDELSPHTPVDRIAVSAVELLTSVALSRVRQCDDRACGWLFLDTSHRQNRRWCSAADCGNRDRARRHYERATRR